MFMFRKLFKCPKCNRYSLNEECKKCKVKNINPSYKYIKYNIRHDIQQKNEDSKRELF